MVAAIWSTPEKSMMDFPAETFLTFFINHRLLQVNNRSKWRTVKNGSRKYVDKIATRLQHVHLEEPVLEVKKENNGLRLTSGKGSYFFDKVVFATHAPLTGKILRTESSEINRVLSCFTTQSNQAYLHQDTSLMPKSKKCWSSWNTLANLNTQHSNKVALTYYLNRLQPLETKQDMLLTLNPAVSPQKTIFEAEYHHPLFDQKAIDAQNEIPQMQGHEGIYFAGAWTRYGFHEDGILSAVKVAEKFDIKTPWQPAV